MAFLPDVISTCEACRGARFEPATLEVKYANLSAGDVLQLSAEEAAEAFQNHRKISRPLQTLCDLGVGYLQIGQGSHTLSGGEAQRLKLAAELTAKIAHEPTVYVLDEPTTGLHLSDARRLISVLDLLVARGDTLIVIEHHPDVIASADWVVELGPEGGMEGGSIVYEGEARSLAKAKTPTGKFFARAPETLRYALPNDVPNRRPHRLLLRRGSAATSAGHRHRDMRLLERSAERSTRSSADPQGNPRCRWLQAAPPGIDLCAAQ
jgi:excinuclease ABC subunit A